MRLKRVSIVSLRTLTICVLGIALLGPRLDAQEFSRYRAFDLGDSLASVVATTGVAASEVKTLHERPALLQDLEWRPSRWVIGTATRSTDSVEQIEFSFYNDQLFRIVVDYGHDGTEGMTNGDLIEAISAIYGAALAKSPRAASRVPSAVESDSGAPVGRWGDADHSIVLYRSSSYRSWGWRLIVTALPIDKLARAAETRAARLDDLEAPRREIARQKKEQADSLATAEKVRESNKKAFKA
jgi:hypothetical protein